MRFFSQGDFPLSRWNTRLLIFRRIKSIHALPKHFPLGIAEQVFRAGIPVRDAPSQVKRKQRKICHVIYQHSVTLLAVAQFLFFPPLLRDIVGHLQKTEQVSILFPKWPDRPGNKNSLAILAHMPPHIGAIPLLLRMVYLFLRSFLLAVLRSENGGEFPPDDFVRLVTEQFLRPPAPTRNP